MVHGKRLKKSSTISLSFRATRWMSRLLCTRDVLRASGIGLLTFVVPVLVLVFAARGWPGDRRLCRHNIDDFLGGHNRVGEERVVDQRCLIAVSPGGVPGACRGVAYDGDLESVFEEVPEMGFHAHVCEHASQNHLGNGALSQLQDEIVTLRAPDFVGAGNDGLSVFDEGLEVLEPVGP